MAARKKPTRREFEDRDRGSNAPVLIIIAVALFGLAVLLLYLCFAAPQEGTAMGAIRDALRGLGGSLCFALPLILVWAGALCVAAARGRRPSAFRIVCDALLIFLLFAAVQIFFAERIVRERMTLSGFSNFVDKSYGYGSGGGAIGALLAWPLYRYLGVAGGFIAALLVMAVLLTMTGRVGRLVRWINGYAESRDGYDDWNEPRRGRERRPDDRPNANAQKAARRTPSRDPYSEAIMGSDTMPAEDKLRRSARRRTAPRPVHKSTDPLDQPFDVPSSARAARAARTAGAKSSAAAKTGRAAAAVKHDKPFEGKGAVKPPSNEELFDKFGDFDDFDRLEAESAAMDAAEQAEKDEKAEQARKVEQSARKPFQPDRPSVSTREAPVEDVIEDAPEPTAPVKATKDNNVTIDDLKIEPEAYELPDEDEADAPAPKKRASAKPGIAEASLPKLKRSLPEIEEAPPYNYPPIDMLEAGKEEDTSNHAKRDMAKAKLLEDTLQSFGISAKLTGIAHGPAVTRFELQPAPGVKVSRITSLADDIALNLAAMSVRIEAPIPGKAAVGVEIPNDKVEMVRLRDVLESPDARKHPSRIAVGLGKDNSGRYIVADIAKMPHVLIAGQTGSGKSVCINAIITSILFRASPEEVKLILIDPKVVELSIYNDIPHLVCPVVTDPKKAASALDWAVAEMTKRYKLFAERGVRDIKGYNKSLKPGEKLMPQMVIIIDELADLMMVAPGEVEDSICRLAQLARACGMHLVIATQRPSVNVITGIIKANIPTRIAFSVASQVDSRTMIDHGGAEKLLGNGDMLFVPNGMKSMRVQGAWVSDEEVHKIVDYIKQSGGDQYDQDMIEHMDNATRTDAEKEEVAAEYDPRLPEAIDIVIDMGQASISMLQRRMRIGYAKAGRLIDEMAQRGIVSEADGAKPRQVLVSREQAQAMFEE